MRESIRTERDKRAIAMITNGLSHLDRSVSQLSLPEIALFLRLEVGQGNAEAQYNYGICLCDGRGVSVNHIEASRYFKLSADQFDYGICLRDGRGVSVNHIEAARYFKLSADQGHPDAPL
jgi:TPR repeat protein